MASAIYEWDISNVVLQPTTWVYSPTKFFLETDDKVEFDLGLRMDHNSKCLHVQVRKNDSRSAKATVEIQLLRPNRACGYDYDDSGILFSSGQFPYFIYVPEKSSTVKKRVTSDWKDSYLFDGFTNLSRKNKDFVTMTDVFYIKFTTIRCRITCFSFNLYLLNDEPIEVYLLRCPKSCVQQNFHQFLKADVFSDVVLVVDGQELPAHKIVLSTHSSFFYKMLTTDMIESKDNRIEIKNFSAGIITEMLEYFYTNKTKASNDFTVAVKLIEVAEMYQIIKLKEICKVTLLKNINVNNVLTLLCIADDYNVPELLKKTESFVLEKKDKIVKLAEFKNLFSSRPLLMYRLFMYAIK